MRFFNFLLGFLLPLEVPTKKDLAVWPASSFGIFFAPSKPFLFSTVDPGRNCITKKVKNQLMDPVFSMVFWFNLMKSPFKTVASRIIFPLQQLLFQPLKVNLQSWWWVKTTQLQRLKLLKHRIWLPTVEKSPLFCVRQTGNTSLYDIYIYTRYIYIYISYQYV